MFITPMAGSGFPVGLEHVFDARSSESSHAKSICGQTFHLYGTLRSQGSKLVAHDNKPDPRVTESRVGDTRSCGRCDEIYRRRMQAALPLLPADVLAKLSDQIKDS